MSMSEVALRKAPLPGRQQGMVRTGAAWRCQAPLQRATNPLIVAVWNFGFTDCQILPFLFVCLFFKKTLLSRFFMLEISSQYSWADKIKHSYIVTKELCKGHAWTVQTSRF